LGGCPELEHFGVTVSLPATVTAVQWFLAVAFIESKQVKSFAQQHEHLSVSAAFSEKRIQASGFRHESQVSGERM